MKDKIVLGDGVEIEVFMKNGTFRVEVSKSFSAKDTGMWEAMTMELILDYSDFEKLLKLLKDAWEDWKVEVGVPEGDEL